MSFREDDRDVERTPARTSLEERTMASELRPVGLRARVDRHDRIRWGPVWAGAVTALATYLVMELGLLALDALELDRGVDLPDGGLLTVVAAAIAFFVGGAVAGAASAEHDASDGLLHGLVTWGLGITLFVLLAVVGGGLAWGTLGHTADRLQRGEFSESVGGGADQSSDDGIEERAGAAALMLGATAAAAALGGLLGSRMRQHGEDANRSGLRDVDVRGTEHRDVERQSASRL